MAVAAVEVGKVRINLQDPVRLDEKDATDVDEVASAPQEWLALHPRNDVMERPGCDERDDGRREKPAPCWRVEEHEEAIRKSKHKLGGNNDQSADARVWNSKGH